MKMCKVCKTSKDATGGCLCEIDYCNRDKGNILIPRYIFNKLISNIPLNDIDYKELKKLS